MAKRKDLNIFCSASKREIDEVNNWVIPSLTKQKDIGPIYLHVINYGGEGTIYKGAERISNIVIAEISKGKQCGFGEAHNFAFKTVKPDNYFLITNPGYLHENCVSSLVGRFNNDIGIVEARQLPFSHPKEFDEKTGETPWASGACMLVNSNFFKQTKGFDENFWMYTEDVDLSWRAWLNDYKVLHEPEAVVYHFTGSYFSYSDHRFYREHFWSARNFIYLLWKYWGEKGEKRAIRMLKKTDYPKYFKEEVVSSFQQFKETISEARSKTNRTKLKKLRSKIKVLGFNLYHKLHKNAPKK